MWHAGFVVTQQPGSWTPLRDFQDVQTYYSGWETTNLTFDPGYGPHSSWYLKNSSEIYVFRTVPAGVFDVTPALVDKGTNLPAELTALLTKFGVPDQKRGARYDLGPFEYDPTTNKTVYSWMPPDGQVVPWREDKKINIPSGSAEPILPRSGDEEISATSCIRAPLAVIAATIAAIVVVR